jgi:hypothetical protein
MKHPNEGFLRRFLGTDKLYQEQLKAEQKKQRVEQHFLSKKNKQHILTEQNKTSITKTIDTVYSNRKRTELIEQKTDLKEWKIVNTEYGLFYYNEKQKLWMNSFGVIKKSISEFIQVVDYNTIDTDANKRLTPNAPSNFQIQILNEVGDVNLQWKDNSTIEDGFAIYIIQ